MNSLSRATVAALAIAAFSAVQAQAPDNTRQNQADQMNKTASADTQQNNKTDLALTRRIRASLMADKTLSTYAHNVKIVSVSGNVTLNGVVRSQNEKDAIEAKAQAIVKTGSVENNLKIAP